MLSKLPRLGTRRPFQQLVQDAELIVKTLRAGQLLQHMDVEREKAAVMDGIANKLLEAEFGNEDRCNDFRPAAVRQPLNVCEVNIFNTLLSTPHFPLC